MIETNDTRWGEPQERVEAADEAEILNALETAYRRVRDGLWQTRNKAPARQPLDVRAIRERLQLSRSGFAERFCFPLTALRDWECGIGEPEGAARAFLTVIARDHLAVERALDAERAETALQAAQAQRLRSPGARFEG